MTIDEFIEGLLKHGFILDPLREIDVLEFLHEKLKTPEAVVADYPHFFKVKPPENPIVSPATVERQINKLAAKLERDERIDL